MADGDERFQDFDLAFGLQEAGVVKRRGRCSGDAREGEQIVFVEGLAVQLVYGLDDADQCGAVQNRRDQQGEDAVFVDGGAAIAEALVIRIVDQHRFAVVGDIAGDAFTGFLDSAGRSSWVAARLVHQLKAFVAAKEPSVDGGTLHDLAEFCADDRE